MFNQEEFNNFIIEQGIVGFFEEPIKLSSGRMSSWYVNWRNVSTDVYSLDILTNYIIEFVRNKSIDFDCFFGTPDGGTKAAVISQFKWAKSMPDFAPNKYSLPMGRKHPKDHGDPKDKYFVGAPKDKVLVLEDVTSTGESLYKEVGKLNELKINIVATVALTNRNELMDNGKHISEVLKSHSISYFYMSQAQDLLPLMIELKKPSKTIIDSLKAEYKKHGQFELNI